MWGFLAALLSGGIYRMGAAFSISGMCGSMVFFGERQCIGFVAGQS